MSRSTPNRVSTDPPSSYRAIENLIATYAELVDDGDFAGVGILLADATFTGGAGSVSGRDAIEKMLRDSLIVYEDGTPRTKAPHHQCRHRGRRRGGHGGLAFVLHRAASAARPGSATHR
jgi:hypothetical protein